MSKSLSVGLVGSADSFRGMTPYSGLGRYQYELATRMSRKVNLIPIAKDSRAPLATAARVVRNLGAADLFHFLYPDLPLYLRTGNRPVIVTVYDLIDFTTNLRSRISTMNFINAIKRADAVITISSLTSKEVFEAFGVKSFVTLLGLHDDLVPTEKGTPNRVTVGYIGSFAVRKNVLLLLKAFEVLQARGSSACLSIWGVKRPNDEYDMLYRFAIERKLANVKFMGYAAEERLAETYNSFDIFAHPSSYEGTGLPIIEAMACGIPTAVLNGARIPDEVVNQPMCFKVRDEEDLADAIDNYESHRPGLAERIRQSQIVKRTFNWDRMVAGTFDAYLQTLRGSRS